MAKGLPRSLEDLYERVTALENGSGGEAPAAEDITATAIEPGTATDVQGILAELAARITALEAV